MSVITSAEEGFSTAAKLTMRSPSRLASASATAGTPASIPCSAAVGIQSTREESLAITK